MQKTCPKITSNLSTILKLIQITQINATALTGNISLETNSEMEQIEAMAQAASLHLKQLHHFEKHTFLTSVNNITIEEKSVGTRGEFTLSAIPWDHRFSEKTLKPQVVKRFQTLIDVAQTSPQPNTLIVKVTLIASSQHSNRYEVELL